MPPSVPSLTSSPHTARSSEDPLAVSGGTQKRNATGTTRGGNEEQQSSYNPMRCPTAAGEDHPNTGNASFPPVLASPYGNAYGGGGGVSGGMYGNYGGYNSMYGGGMYGGGMLSPYGMMSPGPLSGINQFLFSVQSVIFSLGQAVQIIGMNTQGLKQLIESAAAMFDHAVQTWHEMQSLEQQARHHETDEDRKRRARLRAMRMVFVAGISYLGYRLVRRILFPQRRSQRPAIVDGSYCQPNTYATPPQGLHPYGSGSGYYP